MHNLKTVFHIWVALLSEQAFTSYMCRRSWAGNRLDALKEDMKGLGQYCSTAGQNYRLIMTIPPRDDKDLSAMMPASQETARPMPQV